MNSTRPLSRFCLAVRGVDGAFNASGTPIQAAVDAAAAGDSIYVAGGRYDENVDADKPRLTRVGGKLKVVGICFKLGGN